MTRATAKPRDYVVAAVTPDGLVIHVRVRADGAAHAEARVNALARGQLVVSEVYPCSIPMNRFIAAFSYLMFGVALGACLVGVFL